jgi:signal transduction histidine kinase
MKDEGRCGTVLILEDDPGVARLQQRGLERAGYTAVCTGTPEEAVGRVRQGGVDLLLVDYRLPGAVNGLEFHEQLRSSGYDVPVILVTGFSDDATVIRALRAGVRDFVTKSPAYLDYLPEAVRRVLKQVRAEEALRDSNRSLEGALGALRSKSDELQAMTQQLWQAAKLATVGELAASIAHELNNPLATVSLRIEAVLAQTPASDPRHRPLEVVEQEVERMGNLVANLLQFSRQGSEQRSTVEVSEELRKSLELVDYHLRHRRIDVVREIAEDLPPIFADPQKLRQVFLNLLTNAADAMPDGGTITVRAVVADGGGAPAVRVAFIDTGTGIAPEHLPHVLEPFYTTKEEGKGTGLGLAICRRIVQEHRGAIEITSAPGKGTTVSLQLPVARDAKARPAGREPMRGGS